jgi:type IV secretion system protein VirB10
MTDTPTTPSDPSSPKDSDPRANPVDRGLTSVAGEQSIRTRVNHFLALALITLLGVGALTVYYSHLFATLRTPKAAQIKKNEREAADSRPPRFPGLEAARAESARPLALDATAPELAAEYKVFTDSRAHSAPTDVRSLGASPQVMSEVDRELASHVMWHESPNQISSAAESPNDALDRASARESSPLASLLETSRVAAVRADTLPTQRLWLAKGAFLDCTLESAIDSTLPGMTTCVTAVDVFGVDGRVVLMERGTQLVGETRSEVRSGQARVFVIWTEARTPTGVIIPLASPGTDAQGRAGLSGHLETHFAARFGAAILVSVIEGVIQGAVQSQNRGSSVVLNPQSPRDVMTEILKNTVAIPPTVSVNPGTRVAVIVARDVDFRQVYELARRD